MNTFVKEHNLWTDAQWTAAKNVAHQVQNEGLELIRLSFADQHGVLRGKSIFTDKIESTLENGATMTTTLLLKDTSHRTVFPVWQAGAGLNMDEMVGAGNFVMIPDPESFQILPWAEKTGWLLCDIYFPDGRPIPFSARQILKNALAELADVGYGYVTGLEIECHIFKVEEPNLGFEQSTHPSAVPDVSLISHGYQYLTENRIDEVEPVMQLLRRELRQLDLPLRSIEVEFGPSQCEFVFDAQPALLSADKLIFFRSAVKQICQRHGFHATFMCRPGLPNVFSSGWHLHQSLVDIETGSNAMMPESDADVLSVIGRQFMAGILEHTPAACLFSTPTINGYKRYRPFQLAPDRIVWGQDNKGAMIRVLGGSGDAATRIENRVGSPAANPYLYFMSQIYAGLDGIQRQLEPPPPTDEPYGTTAQRLPSSLLEAIESLRSSAMFRNRLGPLFVDYMLALKEFEFNRFMSEVTDWEHREYFGLF